MKNKLPFLSTSLLWFGAAISIAEILTGALLAPLGFAKGAFVIVIGHLIGCLLLYACGWISAKNNLNGMQSTAISFGKSGAVFFSALNILQLIGWTAVMILAGSRAISGTLGTFLNGNPIIWCIVIGSMILVWIGLGIKKITAVNSVSVSALLILCIVLAVTIAKNASALPITSQGALSFGLGLELSIIMPVSWLPLIGDYTCGSKSPRLQAGISATSYFIGSCFMYLIGLSGALFVGSADIVTILLAAGLGFAAILIVLLSTVTTTFLDAFSAGESIRAIQNKLKPKPAAMIVTIIGTLIAIFTPIERYENFLTLIGSVFIPMSAILITDAVLLKKNYQGSVFNLSNSVLWLGGFLLYRFFLSADTPIGSTIPVFMIVIIAAILTNKLNGVKK